MDEPQDSTPAPKKKKRSLTDKISSVMFLVSVILLGAIVLLDYLGDLGVPEPEIAQGLKKKIPVAFAYPEDVLTYHIAGRDYWGDMKQRKNMKVAEILNHEHMSFIRSALGHPNPFAFSDETHMSLRTNGRCHLYWNEKDFSSSSIWSSPMLAYFLMEHGQLKDLIELTMLHELSHCEHFLFNEKDWERKKFESSEGTFVSENYADVRAVILFSIANPQKNWRRVAHAMIVSRAKEAEFFDPKDGPAVHASMASVGTLLRNGIPETVRKSPTRDNIHALTMSILDETGIRIPTKIEND